MKRVIVILGIIAVSNISVMAREIRGVVVGTDSIPIEFANVTAFASDSVVGGALTDETGMFRLEVGQDCDKVRISSVGYDDVMLADVKPDMGVITLSHSSATLQEVVVKAPLIRREADRIVLNVAANPLSADKNAQELLKTAPGVWATDDALSIYGRQGTAVYIDDRKVNMSGTQLMTYLKSVRSSAIATIEIIPNAGAEYSADSAGGVIRINLRRKRVDGLNGSAGLNVTAGEYKQWFNPFANVSLHSGKWTFNLSGNANGSPYDRYVSYEESENRQASIEMNGVSRHKKRTMQGNVSLGVFYEPTKHDAIGMQVDYNPDMSRHTSESRTETNSALLNMDTYGIYRSHERIHNLNATVNWSHEIDDKGSVLKLVSGYNRRAINVDEDNRMSWPHIDKDSVYTTDNSSRYDIFVAEMSLRKAFGSRFKLDTGVKYTLNDVYNRSYHHFLDGTEWRPDVSYDYDASYRENIVGLYAAFTGQAGRWRFKAGLRGEFFRSKGNLSDKRAFDIFPNANVSFNLTEKGDYTVALGYNRYIRRPSFQSLNPVVRQVSDYNYTVGNPGLGSSFTNSVSLDFVLAGKFTVAAGYSETDHPIRQMFESNTDYPERLYLTWGNEGKDRNFFIHGDGFVNITKWWSLYSSVTYMVTSQKLSAVEPFETFGYLQLVASTTFQMPWNLNLTVSCFYNSRMKIGNITVYPIFNLNPTLQKRFGKHWTVSLGVEDILQRNNKIRTASSGYDRFRHTKSHIAAKLGVTYSFNSGKSFRSKRIERNSDNSRLVSD